MSCNGPGALTRSTGSRGAREWAETALDGRRHIQVPPPFPGAGRRVRPGAQQLASSVLSDLPRHLAAHLAQLRNLFSGDAEAAEAHRRLYGELRAVMDPGGVARCAWARSGTPSCWRSRASATRP